MQEIVSKVGEREVAVVNGRFAAVGTISFGPVGPARGAGFVCLVWFRHGRMFQPNRAAYCRGVLPQRARKLRNWKFA